MNLESLAKTIEFELHAAHELSTDTVFKVIETIESQETQSVNTNSVALSHFDKVLINTINEVIIDIKEPLRKEILTNMIKKAQEIIPSHLCIYFTYALIKVTKDRDNYIKKLMKKSIDSFDKKMNAWLKLVIYFGIVITLLGCISLVLTMQNTSKGVYNKQYINIPV